MSRDTTQHNYNDIMASCKLVAGVDEAGRGPLAGPVVAAAVILEPDDLIEGLRDSKVLSERRRLQLFDEIVVRAKDYAIAEATVEEIDRLNILQATLVAMQRAVQGLASVPQHVLVDGNCCPSLSCAVTAVIKGDQKVAAISAASILAKVTRDRLLCEYEQQFPGYGFAQHKGYGTKQHLAALQRLGAVEVHRRSFAPVRAVLAGTPQPITTTG